MLAAFVAAGAGAGACTTVSPGPNFVVADEHFNEDYFYCHVEPQLLVAKRCGPGDPSRGDPSSGCHFNSSAVSGMPLLDHVAVDCGGGDTPVNTSQIGAGSAAQSNFQSASLEMSRDYRTAPLYVRPTGSNHPRVIFTAADAVVTILQTWAQKP